MKKLAALALTALFGLASAQTQVGQVTLTPVNPPRPAPVKPRPYTAPAPVRPAPAPAAAQMTQTTRTASQTTTTAKTTYTPQATPNGWYNLTGKVRTNGAVSLPAGSKVQLSLEDLTTGNSSLKIQFGASSLPVPYQMQFNPAKLQKGHKYGVRAKVFNAQGVNIYTAAPAPLTMGSHTLDIPVNFVR